MSVKTKTWDASEHLDSEEMIFAYMNAAMEEGDPALVTAALGDIARARGMTAIAKTAGLSRESLYRALTHGGNPEFATVMKVMHALGLELAVAPQAAAKAKAAVRVKAAAKVRSRKTRRPIRQKAAA